MSKIVNWGHWAAGAYFIVLGVENLWYLFASVPSFEHPNEVTYLFMSEAFLSVPALFCAWGVFKWRRWGRTLGIVLSAVLVFAFSYELGMSLNAARDGARLPVVPALYGLPVCFVLVWLLLPTVRAKFARRERIA